LARTALQCWYTKNSQLRDGQTNQKSTLKRSPAESRFESMFRKTAANNPPMTVRGGPDWARQEAVSIPVGTAVTVIDFTAFIGRLATSSGETILPFFRTSLSIDNKSASDFDPVTEADRAAEAVMRRLIKANFPQHGIVGEEFGNEREDADYVWVLDPIDGTKSFIAGFPIWGTLIALLHKGTPVFGMMHQPYIGERFSGDSGSAHYSGPSGERRLTVRRCASLKEATSFTTSPLLMNAADREAFGRVEGEVRLTRYGGDCYSYCMLAAGHLDLVVETELKPYDIAALIPIVTGAGGVVTNWEGKPAQSGGRIVAAGDARLHEAALKLLNSQDT
jgi:histidinol phosphatase-like enzyme (inositol monophosphatase family)